MRLGFQERNPPDQKFPFTFLKISATNGTEGNLVRHTQIFETFFKKFLFHLVSFPEFPEILVKWFPIFEISAKHFLENFSTFEQLHTEFSDSFGQMDQPPNHRHTCDFLCANLMSYEWVWEI